MPTKTAMIWASRRPKKPRNRARRALYSISVIVVVMVVGTLGFHSIEGLSYVDSLYFESMMAAGQGPPFVLTTDAGKVFASIMGFVSLGAVATTIVFTLGPVLSDLWREGLERVEEEARTVERELAGKKEKESQT
jgi:voltage-gated potassium channel